jgi:streptogramin lyase
MGVVYRARDLNLDRPRAIKIVAPALSADAAFASRFRRESRLAASVEHPNVVPVHSAGEDDGLLYLVMRLVEGTDLHRMLEDGPLPPEWAIAILRDVAAGLDAAHRAGLVHRDVKPANVLVEHGPEGERVFLTDFGISKPTTTRTAGGGERRPATALTMEGEVLGTADYVAPEQVEDGRSDARSDIYSLACVAYHALTGHPPFSRDSELATLIAQTKAPRPAASESTQSLGAAVDEVLSRGMAIDPAERPATAKALIDELDRAIDPSEAVTPVTGRRRTPATKRMQRPGQERRRGGRLAVILGALLLAGAAAAAAVLLLGGDDDGGELSGPAVVTREVGKGPVGVAVGDERVWVAARDQPQLGDGPPGQVERLRRAVPEEAKPPIPLPAPRAIAIGLGKVWVVNGDALFELGGGAEPREIPLGGKPDDVAVDNNYVWVSDEEADAVFRVDPFSPGADGAPAVMKIPVGDEPRSITAATRTIWVANAGDGTITRITPSTGRAGPPIPAGTRPTSIAAGPSSVWVADNDENLLRQFDIRTGELVGDPIPVATAPRGVAVGLSSVWVASGAENVVERFDAQTHERIGDPIRVGLDPADIAVGESAVYTANQDGGTVTRIQP